jgi:hypothetical protein
MSKWQLARKPIPFPVRRQYDALASPHGLLFREIRNESFPAQQARDTLEVRSGSSLTFRASAAHFRSSPESRHSLALQYLSVWADAVEKGFSVPERRRLFQERLPVENIDSNISYLGFYYCPSWRVRRSLIDFFNSIGH